MALFYVAVPEDENVEFLPIEEVYSYEMAAGRARALAAMTNKTYIVAKVVPVSYHPAPKTHPVE